MFLLSYVYLVSGIVPLLGVTAEMQNLVYRQIYPFLLMVMALIGILSFQICQFKSFVHVHAQLLRYAHSLKPYEL